MLFGVGEGLCSMVFDCYFCSFIGSVGDIFRGVWVYFSFFCFSGGGLGRVFLFLMFFVYIGG